MDIRIVQAAAVGVICCLLFACADSGSRSASSTAETPDAFSMEPVEERVPDHVPASIHACYACHREIVETYLEHGMARSIGPAGRPDPGRVVNPYSGNQYELVVDGAGAWLRGTTAGGGRRLQRLVGRIGAGIFDISWVGVEVDPVTRVATDRLFFAPVETITDHGLELSPFELRPGSAGLDFGLNQACLTCHTTTNVYALPGASASPDEQTIYPDHALGADAFAHLQPLMCSACHGDARRHVTVMSGLPDESGDLGIESLGQRPAAAQRDVCARCHLQGEARFELVDGTPASGLPVAGQIPVLVATHADDDFRFVGQLERLALSACFKASPEMTCTTCHDAHTGVARQGVERFDAACVGCHTFSEPHTSLAVDAVTGEPARTADGCVDCHVRRSQPFDLPHVRTADHYIRRTIPRPESDIPHRQFTDSEGPLQVYDDGRLADVLRTPAGKRWNDGVIAMGLVTMGRMEEAVERFDRFPPPGTPEALASDAPDGLVPLATLAAFHHARGIALMAANRPEEALAAFFDALDLDPYYAGARMERARLRTLLGNLRGALEDTKAVLDVHPGADAPWKLNAAIALQSGRMNMAAAALESATQNWPFDAVAWQQLAQIYRQLGQEDMAQAADRRARTVQP